MGWFSTFLAVLRDCFQILLLAGAVFLLGKFLRVFRGMPGGRMLLGMVGAFAGMSLLAMFLHLDVVLGLLKYLAYILGGLLLVIFQPELRRALLHLLNRFGAEEKNARDDRLEKIAIAVERLAALRHGAILAIERSDKLRDYEEGATILDAPLQPDLLASIFYPNAPLHDGGVTIIGDLIHAARCVFPISEDPLSSKKGLEARGTRHRAALGLSEQTDAAVIVVSEETGEIRIFNDGHFTPPLNPRNFRRCLRAVMPRGITGVWPELFPAGGGGLGESAGGKEAL